MPTPEVKEHFPVCTCTGRLLGGQKRSGPHPIRSMDIHTQDSAVRSTLEKLWTRLRKGPRPSQLWRKKQNNWPNINKDVEELSYISDLNTFLLYPSSLRKPTFLLRCLFLPCFWLTTFLLHQDTPQSSMGVHFCLASVLNRLFLCVLSHTEHWRFSFSISSSSEYSGSISFWSDWFDLLAVRGTLRVFSSIKVQKH